MFDSYSKRQKVIAILALVAIAGTIAILAFQHGKRSRLPLEFTDVNPMTVLAQETTKLLGGTGQVVLVTLDSSQFSSARKQTDDFRNALGKSGGLTIAGTVVYKPDLPIQRCSMETRLFLETCKQYPKVDAVVSLIGAPELAEQEWGQLGQDLPKLIVFSPCAADLKNIFDRGLLRLAIIPSGHLPSATDRRPRSATEQFDLLFRIVTPATAASGSN